jgi:hypothetical protein
MAWIGAHLSELRRSVSEERFRYGTLWFGFVVGLAAHVGGYLLRASAATAPIGLLGDLLYTLGWALWTGAVVVVLLQIYPEAKRHQITRALDAYEAALSDGARAGRDQTSPDGGAPTGR